MGKKYKITFNVEDMYQDYLKLAGLDESLMFDQQRIETRRAFMAGAGTIMVVMTHDLPELEQSAAELKVEDMMNQVGDFWKAETKPPPDLSVN